MKLLFATCLLMIAMPSMVVSAQRNDQRRAPLTRTEIKEAEQRLSDLGYWAGPIDGVFDTATRSALIAFQKWEGRVITGELTIDELKAIRTGARPRAKEPGYEHAEVDLDRQVLLLVDDAGGVRVLPVSTGHGKTFMDEGQESVAYTPRGRFLVYDKDVGWHSGPLGSTYYANFISGGVAIHGARSVPERPASHGCVRIPMFAAREVSKLLKVGTIVLVYDRVSFVSAKDWIKNPKLKEAALSSLTAEVDDLGKEPTKGKSTSLAGRRSRSKQIRA